LIATGLLGVAHRDRAAAVAQEFGQRAGLQALYRALNQLYRTHPELHELDFHPSGFDWIDCHDADQSVLAFERKARDGRVIIAALNFTPMVRSDYRIGLPRSGAWREILNSDSRFYGGSDCGNKGTVAAEPVAWMGRAHSATVRLPPLAAIFLAPQP